MPSSITLSIFLSCLFLFTHAEKFTAFEFPKQTQQEIPAYFDPYGQPNTHFGGWTPASTFERPTTAVLSNLFKSYTLTMQDLGITSWLAQGTLLSWYWNRRVFPWETDIDMHVKLSDLYLLAQYHNMTVYQFRFADTPEGKFEEYLLDVNPHYETRIVGRSDRNRVDARWVDMANGAYIDITAVHAFDPHAQEKGRPFLWQTKDGHIYDDADIYPLMETIFEGILTYVPNKAEKVSAKDYSENALKDNLYKGYKFDARQKQWVSISSDKIS